MQLYHYYAFVRHTIHTRNTIDEVLKISLLFIKTAGNAAWEFWQIYSHLWTCDHRQVQELPVKLFYQQYTILCYHLSIVNKKSEKY